jgi:hypothetical protein
VPDQHHLVGAELLDDRHHVLAEGGHGQGPAAGPGLAVPGEVDRHRPVAGRQRPHLAVPVAPVAGPAVDEHHRRRPGPVDLEDQGDAVPGGDDATHRTIHLLR